MEVMFVLLLYMNDNLKEWMGHWENPNTGQWSELGMSGCLSMKRTLKRNGWKDTASGKTRFTCEKRTVELKTNREGNIVVARYCRVKHLKDINMNWSLHLWYALTLAGRLFLLSLIALVHGILPFIFTSKVSDGISSLDSEIWIKRNDKDTENNSGSL